jgi:hypothetical protein
MFNGTPATEGLETGWRPEPGMVEAPAGIMLRGIVSESRRDGLATGKAPTTVGR